MQINEKGIRGGSRLGAGRKRVGDGDTIRHSIRLTEAQKAKAGRIGAQAVRDLIDAAPEPGAGSQACAGMETFPSRGVSAQ